MFVGLLRLRLHIPEARSLKDRRGAVRKVVERIRARYNVCVAEVGDANRWQIATVAVSAVSGDHATLNELLDRVADTALSAASAIITDRELLIQPFSDLEPLDPTSSMRRITESEED